MPYVPGFDYDLFISYAAADNDQGVVEQFVATLEKQISDNLVNTFSKEKVRVYFDRQRLATQAGVNWEEQLKAAASSSAILVPLLSPNYLSSHYCSKERGWFGTQPHVSQGCPYAVTGWVPIGQNPQPKEFDKAQRHPAGDSWLALARPEERLQSCREFALKLRDALVEMRESVSAVFLGPAVEGRGAEMRSRLMDELEKSGHRVVPGPDFVYKDPEAVRAHLKSSLLAIHFPGDGLDLEGLMAIEESFLSARKTLLVLPMGSTLSDDEAGLLEEIDAQLVSGGRFAGKAYSRLAGKTDDQIWEVVRREVRAARFQQNKSEFAVGIACEEGDLLGAKALADLIGELGIPARYPSFDTCHQHHREVAGPARHHHSEPGADLLLGGGGREGSREAAGTGCPPTVQGQGLVSGSAHGHAEQNESDADGRMGPAPGSGHRRSGHAGAIPPGVGLGADGMTPGAMPQNPFPGLRPFKPEESTLFFGRDEQIGEALDRLMRQKLLAVVGVSGCGKSSLVTAGMVPTLEMGLAGDPRQQWRIEIMRPGDGPLRELERCLGFGGGPLAQRTYALREAVKANLPADQNLLLVVDQFEEIFPFRDRMREGGGTEADLFISYLLSAAQEPAARIYIILTMRSDYLGECAKFHGLPEALNDGQYLVPRMTRSQLQEAIENPLEAIVGTDGEAVQFHPGLVQKLLNDCDEEPDNLPLLAAPAAPVV